MHIKEKSKTTQVHDCFLEAMHSLHLSILISLYPITRFNITRKGERKFTAMVIKPMIHVLLLQFNYYLQIQVHLNKLECRGKVHLFQ